MTLYCDLNMMLGYVKNRQPVLFHSHPGQLGIKWDAPIKHSWHSTIDEFRVSKLRYREVKTRKFGRFSI